MAAIIVSQKNTCSEEDGEKSNYCRLAVNITATNRLNYCAHVLAPGCFMHMCCKPLHWCGPSTLLTPSRVEIKCGPERVEIKKKKCV